MKIEFKLTAAVLAVLMMASCSREGFKDSLNRTSSSGSISSAPQEEALESDKYIFELDVDEFTEGAAYYYYALPRGLTEEAKEPAETIGSDIQSVITSLAAEIPNGKATHSLSVYDAITKNDGEVFSTDYEITYVAEEGGEKERYGFGIVFDSATGKRLKLSKFIDAEVLITLILDEQSSKIGGKKEELIAKKRQYLNEQGADKLKERLEKQGGLDVLLDASFYIDGSRLVAVFAAPQDIGGIVEVSINL